MCGICGVFDYGAAKGRVDEPIRSMADSLVHRGPDDEGYHVGDRVALAARRLAIIDLAGGHQPLDNEDGSVWVTYNGEIYNFPQLRDELIRRGHELRTRSDTEVLVHLYEEHGADMVRHLDGMFAFAIHDAREGRGRERLLLFRDRVGKKPLYYADLGGRLVFGSELKALLRHPEVRRELDPVATSHYLSLLVVPAPYTIFRGIRKLPAGHLLECDASGIRIRRYWSYLDHLETNGAGRGDDAVSARRIRDLVFQAVEKRLISDVPLGAFLSGGLDSSTVVGVMAKLMGPGVKSFSIGFEGSGRHDELAYAALVAKRFRTDHTEIVLRPDIIGTIETIARYADEPFAVSSSIPTYLLSKAARQHVTVVLTGDGGDEVFAGYPTYVFERWARIYRHFPSVLHQALGRAAGLLAERSESAPGRLAAKVERFTAAARQDVGGRRLGWGTGFPERDKQALLLDRASATGVQSTAGYLRSSIDGWGSDDPAVLANAIDFQVFLPDEMLTKVDRMTMAASVEARCPLLDQDLVEYVAGIPMRQKVNGRSAAGLKHLLRFSMGELLPPETVGRRKQGFVVPLDDWFRGGARGFLQRTLSPERVERRGVFSPEAVSDLVGRHLAGRTNAANRLYALLAFEIWADEYLG